MRLVEASGSTAGYSPFAAIDRSLERLGRVTVPTTITGYELPPVVPDDAPDFVKRVTAVLIVDPVARAARVIVPDYQLSLAIGREGQNARLAARLTGWRIDIRSDTAPPPEPRVDPATD